MRLEQLRQLVVLEEELSISKAAKTLYMTQPALSMSLNHLENELGMRLFERSANGVVPTAEEQAVSCFVRGILQDMKRLEQLHEQFNDEEKDAIVATVPLLYDEVVMRILQLRINKPEVKTTVLAIEEEQILDSLYTGQCDLAVVGCSSMQWERLERQLKMKRISYEALGEVDFKLCVSREHLLAKKPIVSCEDILQERLIFHKGDTQPLRQHGLLKGVVHPNWLAVDDQEILKKLVNDGYGIGIVHSISLTHDPYFFQGPLMLRNLDGMPKRTGYLLYDKQRYQASFWQEILDGLCQESKADWLEDTVI